MIVIDQHGPRHLNGERNDTVRADNRPIRWSVLRQPGTTGDRGDQLLRVGVLWMREQGRRRPVLHHLSAPHHGDLIADLRCYA